MRNDYWLLLKRGSSDQNVLSGALCPAADLPASCIVEWTTDDLVYVWPVRPQYESLCSVCKTTDLPSPEQCNPALEPGYPCRFDPFPEAELNQDFDDMLIDGDYIMECGYFHSFSDFARQHDITSENYILCNLGIFSSIREARQSLKKVSGNSKT